MSPRSGGAGGRGKQARLSGVWWFIDERGYKTSMPNSWRGPKGHRLPRVCAAWPIGAR